MNTPVFHLHPPKTGGSTIIKTVMRYFSQPVQNIYRDSPTGSIHLLPGSGGTTPEDHFSLSVRNPYQRFVSMVRFYPSKIKFLCDNENPIGTFFFNMERMKHSPKRHTPARMHSHQDFILWSTQSDWYNLAKGDISVIKFETLKQDMARVYNIANDELFLHIQQFHREYVLSDWTRAFPSQHKLNQFNEIVTSDFELFGYNRFDHIDDLFDSFISA